MIKTYKLYIMLDEKTLLGGLKNDIKDITVGFSMDQYVINIDTVIFIGIIPPPSLFGIFEVKLDTLTKELDRLSKSCDMFLYKLKEL